MYVALGCTVESVKQSRASRNEEISISKCAFQNLCHLLLMDPVQNASYTRDCTYIVLSDKAVEGSESHD